MRYVSAVLIAVASFVLAGAAGAGTVTMTKVAGPPAPTLTIEARPPVVVYGRKTTLTGTLSSQKAGENVDVLATACPQTAAQKVATVQTTTGGAYAAVVQPLLNTAYTVRSRNATSTTVTVIVRPRLRLGKVAPRRYSVRVFAPQTFAGKYATFQRYNGTLRRWVAVRRVLLRPNTTGVAPTVISSATFGSTIRTRLRVRVVLPQAQVGGCYAAGTSNTILS